MAAMQMGGGGGLLGQMTSPCGQLTPQSAACALQTSPSSIPSAAAAAASTSSAYGLGAQQLPSCTYMQGGQSYGLHSAMPSVMNFHSSSHFPNLA
jgi:hypothetical protein